MAARSSQDALMVYKLGTKVLGTLANGLGAEERTKPQKRQAHKNISRVLAIKYTFFIVPKIIMPVIGALTMILNVV